MAIEAAGGYKTLIEEPTPDGKGRVDVSIEKNGKKIACEIGITTNKEWEVHNVEKCLAAGFDIVVAISNDTRGIDLMQKQISEKLDTKLQSKVLVMEPEQFFLYLDTETAKESTTEKRVKGASSKNRIWSSVGGRIDTQAESVAKAVLDSLKKDKKD